MICSHSGSDQRGAKKGGLLVPAQPHLNSLPKLGKLAMLGHCLTGLEVRTQFPRLTLQLGYKHVTSVWDCILVMGAEHGRGHGAPGGSRDSDASRSMRQRQ